MPNKDIIVLCSCGYHTIEFEISETHNIIIDTQKMFNSDLFKPMHKLSNNKFVTFNINKCSSCKHSLRFLVKNCRSNTYEKF